MAQLTKAWQRPLEGQQPSTTKFVFDVKYREDGTVLNYKARLVARGFTQIVRS